MENNVLLDISKNLAEFGSSFKAFRESVEAQNVANVARFEALERKIKGDIVRETGPSEIPRNKWSWARYCYATATKNWNFAPYEREVVDRHMEKTMQAGNFSAGGAMVPSEISNDIIQLLRAQLVLESAGVQIVTPTGSPYVVPRVTSGSTGYWVTEGSSITASDLGTGQLTMAPKKAAALVKISNDLRSLNNPSTEAMVRSDIVRTLRDKVEVAFFAGTGVAGQPIGLDNQTPSIPTSTYTSTDSSTKITSLKKMLKTLELVNALVPNVAYIANVSAKWVIETLLQTNGTIGSLNFYGTPGIRAGDAPNWFGYKYLASTNVPADKIYCGNWNDTLLAIWDTIEVAASDTTSTAFINDELWIRAILRCDVGVRNEKSLTVMTSVT